MTTLRRGSRSRGRQAPRRGVASRRPQQPPAPPAPEPEVAELDLGATVLPVLIKTYAPRIIAGLVALWLLKKLFSR